MAEGVMASGSPAPSSRWRTMRAVAAAIGCVALFACVLAYGEDSNVAPNAPTELLANGGDGAGTLASAQRMESRAENLIDEVKTLHKEVFTDLKGPKGPRGHRGVAGPPGVPGPDGQPGQAGQNGNNGAPG